MTFEVSELLEWAWAILQYTLDRVFLYCLLIFFGILLVGLSDAISGAINRIVTRIRKGRKKVKRRTD